MSRKRYCLVVAAAMLLYANSSWGHPPISGEPAPYDATPAAVDHNAFPSRGELPTAETRLMTTTLREATDLDVTYIERTPRYDYDAAKNNPAPGDSVTFHGHIRNWGSNVVAAADYRWQLDGATVATGTLTDLAPGEEREVTWSWTWAADDHWITLTVDPDNLVAESSEQNNEIEDRTNAIIAGFWVEQSVYNYFRTYQRNLGIGSNSWEDWIQRQMAKQNDLYAAAIWPPLSPEGALDRVRIDKIIVVPDGALPLNGGLPSNNPDTSDKTVDLMWGFPATLLDGTFYSNHTTTSLSNPFYIETSLIHELGHARYLIDCYGFDVHNTSSHDSVQIWEGDVYVAGSSYMPFIAFGEVLYYNKSGGVMSGPYGFQWSPYETAALNLIAGQRALCGNYNAPCNIGVFLQDLPQHNHFRFEDAYGRPRANAGVTVYRAEGDAGAWYGKTFDNIPDAQYTTDSDGWITFPRNPFNPGGAIQHTYGIANGVMILRIQHVDQIWYRFVEATDFNMEYWAGNTQDAYYHLLLDGPNDDTDADGLPDDWEMLYFGDLTHGGADDEEPDGLTNSEELQHGTNPLESDSDGDTLTDGDEVNVYGTDPMKQDTDDDGLSDAEELADGTLPNNPDTDSDTMTDGWEVAHGLDPLVDDADGDMDQDGFTNVEEFNADTDPGKPWSIPVPPQTGTALSFDGVDDFLNLGDVAVAGNQLTVEAWVNPRSIGSARVLEKLEDYGIQFTAGNIVRFMTKHGFTWDVLDGQQPVGTNGWTHIACTLDGLDKTIYVNGVLDQSKPYNYDVRVTSNDLIVAASSPAASEGFLDGVVDDVRVWSVGRNEAEIQAAMNSTLVGNEPGLAGYWRLDEGSGQAATDSLGLHEGRLGLTTGTDPSDPAWVSSPVAPDPAGAAGPDISQVTIPPAAGYAVATLVTAEISDAAQGGDGVISATLYYAQNWPYNDFSAAGAGPGGNGDGTWTFTIPPQGAGSIGQTLFLFFRADDGLGNPTFDSNAEALYTITIGLPGDADGDGDVDLNDYPQFAGCLSGPGQGAGSGCDLLDFDGDTDVDLADFAEMQGRLGGA